MASIELSGVSRAFGEVKAVTDLNIQVADSEFVVLLGPSGAGKTTTLRLIAGLEHPDAGRIRMDGADITGSLPASRDCAFVFQQYSLYPHLSVFDNLAFPLRSRLRRSEPAEVKRRVEEVAAMLHIDCKLSRRATELSGGEMQRVAIGRALVRRPRVFLMDEPLSSLDAQLREELRVELRRLQRSTGATVIYVTHDHVEATTMADRIGILEGGVLQQLGTPLEVYGDPRTLPVAQRLGAPAINVLPAQWFDGRSPAGTAHVAIRPEDVLLSHEGEAAGFQVVECSLVKHQLVAERQGVEVHACVMLDEPLAPGSQARFAFPAERCLFFDAAGRRITAAAGMQGSL
jgi:multiple sugar transport system ATP-binding protein